MLRTAYKLKILYLLNFYVINYRDKDNSAEWLQAMINKLVKEARV